jgi:hypothetical protein
VARKQDERACVLVTGASSPRREQARSSGLEPVVTLVLKKRLLLKAPRECLLMTLSGKKPCDINKRLDPF